MKEYRFDRYRHGQLMAEGISVRAENMDHALAKALALWQTPLDVLVPCRHIDEAEHFAGPMRSISHEPDCDWHERCTCGARDRAVAETVKVPQ